LFFKGSGRDVRQVGAAGDFSHASVVGEDGSDRDRGSHEPQRHRPPPQVQRTRQAHQTLARRNHHHSKVRI
jgi:hypothetical protein